MYYLLEHSVW